MELAVEDTNGAHSGLVGLVLTVVELLAEAMEKEAIRRMESGELTDEEIERLGRTIKSLWEEIDRLKEEEGVEEQVDDLRGDLDSLIDDAVRDLETSGGRRQRSGIREDPIND
ncbi:gas vesicle protein K [Halodesulfurarchaeum sp.]|uniref:gas vesicle protein K n=1 Tax=Halodesulfurarchaeum sp. TaxID=1980530 RepID=UPI002FC38501